MPEIEPTQGNTNWKEWVAAGHVVPVPNPAICRHVYGSKLGSPQFRLAVRICTLCGDIDWADLDAQVSEIIAYRERVRQVAVEMFSSLAHTGTFPDAKIAEWREMLMEDKPDAK